MSSFSVPQCLVKASGYTWKTLLQFCKRDNFCRQEVAAIVMKHLKNELLLKERLLQKEVILSFKSKPVRRKTNIIMSELFPLKVYPFPWK